MSNSCTSISHPFILKTELFDSFSYRLFLPTAGARLGRSKMAKDLGELGVLASLNSKPSILMSIFTFLLCG